MSLFKITINLITMTSGFVHQVPEGSIITVRNGCFKHIINKIFIFELL